MREALGRVGIVGLREDKDDLGTREGAVRNDPQ